MPHDETQKHNHPPGESCGGGCSGGHGEEKHAGPGLGANMVAAAKRNTPPDLRALIEGHEGGHHHHHDHGSCGHDHSDGGTCSHDHGEGEHHHRHEEEKAPSEYNQGRLKRIFSGGKGADEALNNARSTILLAGAALLTQIDSSNSLVGATALGGAALWVTKEASEELVESVQYIRGKLKMTGAAVGIVLSAAHIGTEGVMAASAQIGNSVKDFTADKLTRISETFNMSNDWGAALSSRMTSDFSQATDIAMQVTMANNWMHAVTMPAVLGLAGAVVLDESRFRKMNVAAMLTTSGLLAAHVVIGEAGYNYGSGYALGLGGIAASYQFARWRIKAGIGCAVHGDLCGHTHTGPKDETDYISWNYLGEQAKRIKDITPGKTYGNLKERVHNVGKGIANFKLPARKKVATTLKAIGPAMVPLTALGIAGHEVLDNGIVIGQQAALPAVAMGITIAGLSVLPETIFARASQREGETDLASAMIVGCTVIGTGFVGGIHAVLGNLSGNPIPDNLSLDNMSGWVQMGALFVPIGAYAYLNRKTVGERFARFDQNMAEKLENNGLIKKASRVSNGLREAVQNLDNVQTSKSAAFGMLAASAVYFGSNTLPLCHRHGEFTHCFDPNVQIEIDPALPSLEDLSSQPIPSLSQ